MKDLKISRELLSEVLKLEVVKHSLYNKKNKLIKKFFSIDNFSSAERMYFYVLENYN